jgi:hypothetical protein
LKPGYYNAIITFDTPAAAQVALLLNTAVVGHEDESITVNLYTGELPKDHIAPVHQVDIKSYPKSEYNQTHTDVISRILSLGYKLKDDALELAKQLDTTVRTNPVVVEASNIAAATVSSIASVPVIQSATEAVKHGGSMALEATQVATATVASLVTASKDQIEVATHMAQAKAASIGETITNTGKTAIDTVATTSQVALDVTTETLKNTGEAVMQGTQAAIDTVATTSQVAFDVTTNALKNTGEAVMHGTQVAMDTVVTTSQVALDVTTNALKNTGEAVIQGTQAAMDTVATNSQVALDVTGNALKTAGNVALEATQVAGATVASLVSGNSVQTQTTSQNKY